MNNRITLSLAAVAALSLSGCKYEGHMGHQHADTAKIAADIKAQEVQWQKDYASKNVDAAAAVFATDGILAAPGEPLATTSAARRKAIQDLTSDPNFKLDFASDEEQVAEAGDLAYSRGHFSIQATDKATNKPVASTGNFLTVFKKQDDGSWKAVADYIVPGPAAAATPAAK